MRDQGTVSIGYCYGNQEQEFIDSMRDLQIYDRADKTLDGRPKPHGIIQNVHPIRGLYVADNRNLMVKQFLEKTKDSWLVSLDCDIDFRPEMVYALYEQADAIKRPVVSGVYFSRLAGGHLCPVWFMEKDNGKYSTVKQIEPDDGQPQSVDAIGMGFCIMHRSVFEKLAEIHGKDTWTWFGHDEALNTEDGKTHHLGEDLTFCRRVKRAGFSIYGHAGIQVGHVKKVALSYELWLAEEHPEQYAKYKYERGCIVGMADGAPPPKPKRPELTVVRKENLPTEDGHDAMP